MAGRLSKRCARAQRRHAQKQHCIHRAGSSARKIIARSSVRSSAAPSCGDFRPHPCGATRRSLYLCFGNAAAMVLAQWERWFNDSVCVGSRCSGVIETALEKRSEEHTSELQSQFHLVCRLLLEKKKKKIINTY